MVKVLFVGGVLALGATLAGAAEVTVRPRLNIGTMNSEHTQHAKVPALTKDEGGAAILPVVSSEWSANFSLPLLRTGFTAFMSRAFFDFDYQYAYNGKDKTRLTNWAPISQSLIPGLEVDHFMRFNTQADMDAERTEFAMTLGYAVTDQLAVYAGYKRTESDVDFDLKGKILAAPVSDLSTPNPSITGFTSQLNQKFIYKGPFLGASYTWNINHPKIEGGLTGNVGLAFLDGKTRNSGLTNFVLSGEDGVSIPLDSAVINHPPFNLAQLNGDTVGLSLALTWNGFTPIDGLMYSVGVRHYRYEFDDENDQDFTVEIFRLDAGVTYSFDL
jgi:hypothetical protein